MKNEHKHFIARLLVGAFLILGMGFWMTRFVVDAANWTVGGTLSWDNQQSFLTTGFWSASPSTGDIITALYGSGDEGTVYTQNWSGYTSGSCLAANMDVVYTGNLSLTTLADNTIYVVTGNISTGDTTITLGNCSAVISDQITGTTFYSTAQLSTGMFYASGNQHIIFDNIAINGTGGGPVAGHAANANGIYLLNDTNNSINNVQVYNHTNNGILLLSSSHNNVTTVQSYNNQVGIYLRTALNNTINNVQTYNNDYGIYLYSSSKNNSINNAQTYNNQYYGIFLNSSADNNTINNVQTYNNEYGMYLITSVNNNTKSIQVYNNTYGVYLDVDSTGNKYYGVATSFNNISGNSGTVANLSAGSGSDYSSLGRATGSAVTGLTMSRDYITNPVNTSNTYMSNWLGAFTGILGQQAAYLDITTDKYSYGNGILTQVLPVYYSGTDLVTGGIFDATKFIGSDVIKNAGALSISGTYVITSGVTIILTGSSSPSYRLFGDVFTEKSGSFTTSLTTGLILSGTDGTKNVFAQIRTNGNRATHYVDSIILDTAAPTFTGTLASGSTILSGGFYSTTGITITFADATLSGATLSGLNGNTYLSGTFADGATITGTGTYRFTVYDLAGNSTGMVFTIDTTNPLVTAISPISGNTITGSYTVNFVWSGVETNLSGYTLYISGTTATGSYATGATGYTVNLLNDTYYWYVLSTDKAGNTGISSTMTLTLNVPLSGTIALSGTTLQTSGSAKYSKDVFPVYLRANKNCIYTITGDVTSTLTGTFSGLSMIVNATLSGADGLKTLYVTLTTGAEYLYTTLTGYLDTTAPTAPTLSTPTSGSITSGAMTLTWSAATDAGVGLSGYRWYISNTGTFASIALSGFTSGVTTTLATGSFGVTGTFYWKVLSLDKLGWTGTSVYNDFYYSGADYTPDSFTFTIVTNALLDHIYLSSDEIISGLSTGTYVLASVSKGVLYINDSEVGSTGLVHNGDTINIELISSSDYDDLVYSTLTIGSFHTQFHVTTKESATNNDTNIGDGIDTNLSTTEQLQVIEIFKALRDVYPDTNLRITFFTALLESLQNRIDALDDTDSNDVKKIEALQYLYDIIDDYLGGISNSDTNFLGSSDRYVAPNGKVYQIVHTTTYTSPNFMFAKTFTTLDAIKAYININNGGRGPYQGGTFSATIGANHTVDTTRQTAPYTAPNHKVYVLFKTTDDLYSSHYFQTAKYFISLEALKTHIDQQNK